MTFTPARTTVALCAAAITALAPTTALAAPSTPEIERVRAQLDELQRSESAAAERYEEATAAVQASKVELRDARRAVETTQAQLASERTTTGVLAAASYRAGSPTPDIARMVTADDPEVYLHTTALGERVRDSQGEAVERVAALVVELDAEREELADATADLEADQDEVAQRKAALSERTAAVAAVLDGLEEEERQRILAERRAAAERRAKERAAEQAQVAEQVEATSRNERASRSSGRSAPPSTSSGTSSSGTSSSGGSSSSGTSSSGTSSSGSSSSSGTSSSGSSGGSSSGSCGSSGGRGAESGLSPTALSVMRCGLGAFSGVSNALGVGNRGNATDHDDGRAVDFMIPRYSTGSGRDLGWAVAEWATKQPGVSYVIFNQQIWAGSGWEGMEDRGSDTANHRDHVHVSVSS